MKTRLLLILALALVVAFAIHTYSQYTAAYNQTTLSIRLMLYCRDTSDLDLENCSDWGKASADNPQAIACNQRSPELDAPFYACLRDEGFLQS